MKTILDYKRDFLCVLAEFELSDGLHGRSLVKEWYPVEEAERADSQALLGRSVTRIDSQEGVYVDEEGNVFQLLDKGETKPIEVEHLPGKEKTELEVQLEASLEGRKTHSQDGDSKRMQKSRRNGRKQQALRVHSSAPQSRNLEEKASAQPSSDATNGAATNGVPSEAPVQLNLLQKLAEVRRRIGYVQKRGHNERFNYSYATAADIVGSVGDILAELGVVVIPRLEDISYESAAARGEARMARIVMAYTFTDVDSREEIVAKVPGGGLDPGDKAPYKAMTGALKYALLQSFLLATGDDPEDERLEAGLAGTNSELLISGDEVRELQSLIDETGTELERVLAYYKVTSLSELTETAYRRAVEILKRKLAKRSEQGTVHAEN